MPAPRDRWAQLTLRTEEDGIALRLDGVRVGVLPPAQFTQRGPFRLGTREGEPARLRVREVARWSHALADEELALLRDATDTLQLRVPDPDLRWDLAAPQERVLVDRGPAALDLVLSAPPMVLRAPAWPRPWDTLLQAGATGDTLSLDDASDSRSCVTLAPEEDGSFTIHDDAGCLAHDTASDVFYRSARREDRVRLRVVARVALSESLLGTVPPDWRVLYEHPGCSGRVYALAPGVDPASLELAASTENWRRDEDEWDDALLAAHHRARHGARAASDVTTGERLRSEWTMLRLLLDDVARGWEIAAAQVGERFPEAELLASLAGRTEGMAQPVRVPVDATDAAWPPEARAFWKESAARRLRISVEVAPSEGAPVGERQVVLARERGIRVWLEASGAGDFIAGAELADPDGRVFTITSGELRVAAHAWSTLVVDWHGGDAGTLSLAVGNTAPTVVLTGPHALASGQGPLFIAAAPPACGLAFRGALRQLRLDGGGSPAFGDWVLDDTGGRVHDRSGLGLHGWVQESAASS